MKLLGRFLLLLALGVPFTSCATKTWLSSFESLKGVTPPTYQSPLAALKLFKNEIDSRGLFEKAKRGTLTNAESLFLSIAAHLAQRQQDLEARLEKDGVVDILPRIPYAFTLESFCVQPSKSSPVPSDGLSLSENQNVLRELVRKIVSGYSRNGVSRERAQLLIWSIESGLKFDEIRPDLQDDLLRISPDAHLELGNSSMERLRQELWDKFKPDEIAALEYELKKARKFLTDSKRSYEQISSVLAPESERTKSYPQSWFKSSNGFLIRARSRSGYVSVDVEIIKPDGIDPAFIPTTFVARPQEGQLLAISASMGGDLIEFVDQLVQLGRRIGQGVLTQTERDLIAEHPIHAFYWGKNAIVAVVKMRGLYPDEKTFEGNEADAFRHVYWSALNSRDTGEELARAFGEAHEARPQLSADKEMDLFNNEIGFQVGTRLGKDASDNEILAATRKAIESKQVTVIHEN